MICDQSIALNGFYASKDYPEKLRRIRFKVPESGKTLVLLTNNTALPAFVEKELHLEASLYTLLQILSVTVFEKVPLQQALVDNARLLTNPLNPNQLTLLGS